MTQDLHLRLDAGVLDDAARVLGVDSPSEAVDRALDLVLQVGETLQGVIARPAPPDHLIGGGEEARQGAGADRVQLVGYRERLLGCLPRETRAGLPLRTAVEAGGTDALLGEIACLTILLEKRSSELAESDRQAQRMEDVRLRLEERGRQLSERVEELQRRNHGLKRELGFGRRRR